MSGVEAMTADRVQKNRTDRVLAEGVCESICATTPRTPNRHHHPRISGASIFAWAAVAALGLMTLAMASGNGS